MANVKAQPSKFLSANNPANKFKNRLVNILPCMQSYINGTKIQNNSFSFYLDENTRVCLSPMRGIEGSDYINASYIDVSHSREIQLNLMNRSFLIAFFSRAIDLRTVILPHRDH